MAKAIVHIGLPKTGTSSFQLACVKAQTTLARRGTLYPLDAWLTYGAMQHQALAVRVKNGDERSIDEDVRRLREQACGYRELLLSAERFSGLFHSPKNVPRMRAFRDSLERRFDDVKFVCVLRSDRKLLRSTIGAKFDGQGMRWDGPQQVRELVESFYSMNRAIVETLGDRLCVLRFEELVAESFPASLFGATLGEAFDVPGERKRQRREGFVTVSDE